MYGGNGKGEGIAHIQGMEKRIHSMIKHSYLQAWFLWNF
jgi:hypothetical protein